MIPNQDHLKVNMIEFISIKYHSPIIIETFPEKNREKPQHSQNNIKLP